MELPVTKSPKIAQFSVGHDGSHALLVAEDGSVFFTGSASKGEDGESSKIISNYLQTVSFLFELCVTWNQCDLKWCSKGDVCYFRLQLKVADSPSLTSPKR